MCDLEIAKRGLAGHTLCLCKDGEKLYSDERGIKPIMGFIERGFDLSGYSAADIVVGKAAAMLFVKCKIKAVYAKTLSLHGEKVLKEYGIEYGFSNLTEKIINRTGDDICPMEKTVLLLSDPEEAYIALKNKISG